jgi:hypothetical protein
VTYLLELVVDLDIGHPPTPNRRLHWAAKARSNAEWRRWTKLAALAAIRSSGMADEYPLRSVLVEPTFYFPTNRRRDEDNLLASLKPVLDGDSRERLRLLSPIVRIAPRKAVRLRVKEAPR